jgi:hypothetical protein
MKYRQIALIVQKGGRKIHVVLVGFVAQRVAPLMQDYWHYFVAKTLITAIRVKVLNLKTDLKFEVGVVIN